LRATSKILLSVTLGLRTAVGPGGGYLLSVKLEAVKLQAADSFD
jgi:hypothetical protein